MKLMWFHLMPYTELPADFRDASPSVWVDIHATLFDPKRALGHLMPLLQYGNTSKQLTRYNTRLFAEQVMPKLKDVHASWTDHWWPRPMEAAQRANVPAYLPKLAAE